MSSARRPFASLLPWLGLPLWLTACSGYDPTGAPSVSDADFTPEMSEVALGTESGNPTEPSMELGTESGNPGSAAPANEDQPGPAQDLGTESGNPTRPSPVVSIEPSEMPVAVEPVPVIEPDPTTQPEPTATVGAAEPQTDSPTTEPVGAGTGGPTAVAPPPTTAPSATPTTTPDGSMVPGAGTAGAPCDPYACQASAEAAAAAYGAVVPAPAPFESSACSAPDTCQCTSQDGVVLLALAADQGVCLVTGRLDCLYSSTEFPGCDTAAASSCDAVCSEVGQAQATDAMGLSVTVRASACTDLGCRFVLQSPKQCYVGGDGLAPELSDCAASDDELLGSR